MELEGKTVALEVTGVMADKVIPVSVTGMAEPAATGVMVCRDVLVAKEVWAGRLRQAAKTVFQERTVTAVNCAIKCSHAVLVNISMVSG
jgi:hypothetical protein